MSDADNQHLPTYADASGSGELQSYEEPTNCPYCNARLNGRYYFCTACGTPFKHWAQVVPPHRPVRLTAEQLVNRKAPQVWTLVGTFATVVLIVSVATQVAFTEDNPALSLLIKDVAIFLTTAAFAVVYWRSLWTQFKKLGLHWSTLAGLALLVPTLAVNWGYHTLLQELLGADGSYFDELREAGLSTGAMIFSFCVIPAVTEEIAFRGLVQHWLQAAIKPMGALILASALFAGMHFNVISFFYLFAVGMLLGWTRLKSGSLYPAMLIHFLHNLIVIEVMY